MDRQLLDVNDDNIGLLRNQSWWETTKKCSCDTCKIVIEASKDNPIKVYSEMDCSNGLEVATLCTSCGNDRLDEYATYYTNMKR